MQNRIEGRGALCPANPCAQAALDPGAGDIFLTESFRERWYRVPVATD